MRRLGTIGIAVAMIATMFGSTASVARAADRLVLDGAALGPFAYTRFCIRYPAECRIQAGDVQGEIPLTPERRGELMRVNAAVNGAITPAPHAGRGTFDTWTIAPLHGDCNDYAVTKRHALLAKGWPSRALLLAEVVTGWGEHHLVLVVRTGDGDVVLDNLSAQVRPWTAPRYTWLRAQMPDEPALWARVVAPPRAVAVGSRAAGVSLSVD